MTAKTCAACLNLDPHPIRTSGQPIFRCDKRMTLERPETPRGDPESPYACPDFTTESDVTG